MRSRAEAVAGALLVMALAACVTRPTPSVTPTTSPPSTDPSATVSASPTPAAVIPEPGRPWDAATVLREMAASTRPDGVPAELQTEAVAEAVADAVWTVDGRAWDTFSIGGFCGSGICTLEVAGTHLDRADEDLWVLEIDPDTADVSVREATVRSLPIELVEHLDGMARELATQLPDDVALATARWLPPPEERGRFALSYRTGGEEGSCSVEIVLDAVAGTLVDETATGC